MVFPRINPRYRIRGVNGPRTVARSSICSADAGTAMLEGTTGLVVLGGVWGLISVSCAVSLTMETDKARIYRRSPRSTSVSSRV